MYSKKKTEQLLLSIHHFEGWIKIFYDKNGNQAKKETKNYQVQKARMSIVVGALALLHKRCAFHLQIKERIRSKVTEN